MKEDTTTNFPVYEIVDSSDETISATKPPIKLSTNWLHYEPVAVTIWMDEAALNLHDTKMVFFHAEIERNVISDILSLVIHNGFVSVEMHGDQEIKFLPHEQTNP